MLRAPELDSVLQIGSQQSRVEGQNFFPWPAGHASCDVAQNLFGFLHYRCTLLAHGKLLVNQHLQILVLRSTISAQPVFVLGIAFKIPLDAPHQVGGVGKLAESVLNPTVHVAYKDVKWHLVLILTSEECCLSPFSVWTLNLWPQLFPSIHPILYPLSGLSIKSISLQFGDKNFMQDSVKCFAQVQNHCILAKICS